MKPEVKNCAIYTRKSTEEGLDQDFNTLDAQRESCEAYITSQRSEGWKLVKTDYDDGGFSGGNMKRPALQSLIAAIKAGQVQTIVVYKIDRLTRSLMDFSKLVEVFDEYGVTFVSVTQSFNTTNSMGRLTLNMLLSFAQFEREVTGERIRDKIAASKKKGMWMGGLPPLGYQSIDKKLVPDPKQSKELRLIFKHYLQCGTVRLLKEALDMKGLKTPVRASKKGRIYGGSPYSRGHLYKILSNPVYIGQIQHKGKIYDGQHEGIMKKSLFEAVQQQLKASAHSSQKQVMSSGSALKGLLYDEDDTIYSPTYTLKKGVRYSYYISQNLLQYRDHPKGIMARIPAHEIEKATLGALQCWSDHAENWASVFPDSPHSHSQWLSGNTVFADHIALQTVIKRITVQSDTLIIELDGALISQHVRSRAELSMGEPMHKAIQIPVPFKVKKANNGAIVINPKERADKDPFDVPIDQLKRIVRGVLWRDEHFSGTSMKEIAQTTGFGQNYISRCIHDSLDFLMR